MTYPHPTPYERLGGAPAVAALVDDFYARVEADPLLRDFFVAADMAKLAAMQREVFTAALGGPAGKSGTPLAYAHRGRGIERVHFARFVAHLLASLRSGGLDDADVHDVIERVNTYAGDVLGGHGASG